MTNKDICEHTTLLLERLKIRREWVLNGIEAVEKVAQPRMRGMPLMSALLIGRCLI